MLVYSHQLDRDQSRLIDRLQLNAVTRNALMVMEATMSRDPDASEWRMLKDYFAALADHDPAQEGQPVDALFNQQIRRRFGDWISRSARNSRSKE